MTDADIEDTGMLVLNPDGKISGAEGLDYNTRVYRKVFDPARVSARHRALLHTFLLVARVGFLFNLTTLSLGHLGKVIERTGQPTLPVLSK